MVLCFLELKELAADVGHGGHRLLSILAKAIAGTALATAIPGGVSHAYGNCNDPNFILAATLHAFPADLTMPVARKALNISATATAYVIGRAPM